MADIYIGNVKGPTGATGATGAQGPQGDAATIEVGTVSTTAYGNTAQVINSGTSSEAVFDFVIPQGRPGEETTTMSSLTLDTVTAQSAEFPIPATGESGAVVFGKIIKFFNDIKTAVNSKINISDIVNNLTSTATNKPLSAAQGKALNDALATTNTAVAAIPGQITIDKTSPSAPITLSRSMCALIGNKIAIIDVTFAVTGTLSSQVLSSMFYFPNREFQHLTDLQCTKIIGGGSTSNNVIIPFIADWTTHRIGVNGGSTSQMTANTSWNLTGIVFFK